VKVALDAQLSVGTSTGIGEYAQGLALALRDAGVNVVQLMRPSFDPWRFDRRVLWDQVILPLAARGAHADLLHCASGTMPLAWTGSMVVTVHDVAWLRVQQHARGYARTYFGAFAVRQYARARRVLVDSAFTGRELVLLAPIQQERIDVVYPGVAQDVGAIVRRPDEMPFVLVVGTIEPRKNLAVVIRALQEVPELRLVTTGPATPYRADCERLAARLALWERVQFRGYVPRRELLDLYARAALVAVPSTYEGFGYSAAWALCAGVPLVAADASSLPEVVGDDAPLISPSEPEAWAASFRAILADRAAAEWRAAAARDAAIARFSWTSAAAAAIASYRRALEDFNTRVSL
jgi:glycosyltransferase involved in cell wall biosynthesis